MPRSQKTSKLRVTGLLTLLWEFWKRKQIEDRIDMYLVDYIPIWWNNSFLLEFPPPRTEWHIETYWVRDKMVAIFPDNIFKCIFLIWKCIYFDLNFTESN